MENLKIHTNNEVESKEVQELLFELGYRFYGNNGTYARFFEHTKQLYLFTNSNTWITYTTSDQCLWSHGAIYWLTIEMYK